MKNSLRIAVAEDEPEMCEFLEKTLPTLGHEVVVTARTGQELVEKCRSAQPDLIISDIRMPGNVNGAEVHAWIQKNRPELRSRIILISGDTANSETQWRLIEQSTPCIEKPFRVQELISVVEKTFGKP